MNNRQQIIYILTYIRMKETLYTQIKDWYLVQFSSDELGTELRRWITFRNVLELLLKREWERIYDMIWVDDSVVRERIFEKLSEILDIDYDIIYDSRLD